MILWKKYKGITKQMMVKIGYPKKDANKRLRDPNYTNEFLVMWRFKKSGGEFELGIASIRNISTSNSSPYVMVHGVTGTIEISHYTHVNPPKK